MTEQSQLGPSYEGSVMLDIGGDIGALILLTGPELLLAEIELSRVDGGPVPGPDHSHGDGPAHSHGDVPDHSYGDRAAPRTHVAVRERRGAVETQYAAIYPSLRAGQYTVWGLDGTAADTVTVVGGEVAQLDWR